MTELLTGPTPAAPATVSTSPGWAAFFAGLRTFITAAGIIAGLAKLLYNWQLAEVAAYLQANDIVTAILTIAGGVSFVWGVVKKYQHVDLLARAAADPRLAWIKAKLPWLAWVKAKLSWA